MPAEYPAFLKSKVFNAGWHAADLDDADLRRLEVEIGTDPEVGASVGGTGGLRKVRFARPGMGKSGGVRVCYAHFPAYGVFHLYAVIQKNQEENLSKAQRNAVAAALAKVEALLAAAKAKQDAATGWERKKGYAPDRS